MRGSLDGELASARGPARLRVSRMLAATVCALASLVVCAQQDLPPQVQARMLDNAIVDALKAQDFQAVLREMDKYRQLEGQGGVQVPPPLLFVEAKAAEAAGNTQRAAVALNLYLKRATPQERNYDEAIRWYPSLAAQAKETAPAACAAGQIKFLAVNDGVLRQCRGSLEWTQADNGNTVDWNGAMSWCAGRGAGWRLPTVAELQAIYDSKAPSVKCGPLTCKVNGPFVLSNYLFWSNEADSPRARMVRLTDGFVYAAHVEFSIRTGALCVRRS